MPMPFLGAESCRTIPACHGHALLSFIVACDVLMCIHHRNMQIVIYW